MPSHQTATPAVVLLSGELNASTVLALICEQRFACHALSFRYGQRHLLELESARRVAQALGAARHLAMDLDLRLIGGSALTSNLEVPKNRHAAEMAQRRSGDLRAGPQHPVYVPDRGLDLDPRLHRYL